MINISRLEKSHLDEIIMLEHECFSIPWTKEMFEEELKSRLAHYYVALDNETLVGYAGMWKILDEGHITNIAVSPLYRNRGVGQSLLDTLIGAARELKLSIIMLEVRKSNIAARSLYEKNGFDEVGIRKGYYQDVNEDAVLMNLLLRKE